MYKFLSSNKKCDGCNSSYDQFNRNYEETNILNDHNINTSEKDLTNTSDLRE